MNHHGRITWSFARFVAVLVAAFGLPAPAIAVPALATPAIPDHLPRYDLAVNLDTKCRRAQVRERVTWTNPTTKPVPHLAFNFYPHYVVPEGDYVLLAKTLELLRLQPSLGIDRQGRHGVVKEAYLLAAAGKSVPEPRSLNFEFDTDTPTTLRFPLPQPLNPGESVTVELVCEFHLPNKQGRWGQWDGVTFLTNALPLVAFCDDSGWRPMPFVPWAQPWFNEAGIFTATITLPANELLACPAVVKSESLTPDGRKQVVTESFVGRDFALLCSARYREYRGEAKLPNGQTVALKCLAFPEHEHYATEFLRIVGEAIPEFSKWFGPFPYPQFTIAESYFGWNGNECAGLIMIDERVFGMPHLLRGYAEYLVSHETCHQWWYNQVGTNGYAEPFLDEGAAAYFTHRLLDAKNGKNNEFVGWPDGLKWMPNIRRENYRYSGMYSAVRNGQMQPAAQDLPRYNHLFGLFTGAYDRGSKAFGMIEAELGEAAFLDFTRGLFDKYGWRVLQAADLRRELEAYTGRSWDEFFARWIFGKGMTDWQVVAVEAAGANLASRPDARKARRVTVTVRQNGEYDEPTSIGLRLPGGGLVRVPVAPATQPVNIPELDARITPVGNRTWKIDVDLPADPEQVTIDPDGILLDSDPGNNRWKPEYRARITPLYTALDEADLTNDYDRWNFVAGPWVWGQTYADPWYTRSTMVGLRAGAIRPQKGSAGAYTGYRTDYRDLVLGFDATLLGKMQSVGVNYERRIGGPYGDTDGQGGAERAAVFHRYVFKQGSSLYLPPIAYGDTFLAYQDNFLPFNRNPSRGSQRYAREVLAGYHLRVNLLTPYWDPECGYWVDLWAAGGQARLGDWVNTGQFRAELAGVKKLPDWAGPLRESRVAGRVVAAGAFPDRGEFFALGGGTLFRGYDLAERQGSAMWVANAELRVPVAREVEWDTLDHCVGVRNVWLTGFYDVGQVYANGHGVGGKAAHALGGGVRVDVAVFSFIERATLRFDFGKTINDNTPFQFWFGVQHAF